MAQLGMVGLGRMGAGLVRRLMRDGHDCVVYDRGADSVAELAGEGATGPESLADFVAKLDRPRAAWVMIPASVTGAVVDELAGLMDADDVIIDGGNSYYRDDIARAEKLTPSGIHYIDCGTSGGVFGLERGFCLMIGGEEEPVERLDPIFRSIAPGEGEAPPDAGPQGRRHGPARLPALRAVRRGPLREDGPQRDRVRDHGRVRRGPERPAPGRTSAPRRCRRAPRSRRSDDPEYYRYDIDVPEVAEVWRRGSVIASWLLDLTAAALGDRPDARRPQRPRVGLGRGPLDDPRGHRRGRARAGAHGGPLRAVLVARRVPLRRPAPVGHAAAVRGAPGAAIGAEGRPFGPPSAGSGRSRPATAENA